MNTSFFMEEDDDGLPAFPDEAMSLSMISDQGRRFDAPPLSDHVASAIDELRQAQRGVPVVAASRSADGGFAGRRQPSFLSSKSQGEDDEDAATNSERQDEPGDCEEDPSSWMGIISRFPKFMEAFPLACVSEADAPDEIAAIQKACEEEATQRATPVEEAVTSAGRPAMARHVRTGSTTASSVSSVPGHGRTKARSGSGKEQQWSPSHSHGSLGGNAGAGYCTENPIMDDITAAWVEIQRERDYLAQREAEVHARETSARRAERRNMATAQQLQELGFRLDAYARELDRGEHDLHSARLEGPSHLERRSRGVHSARGHSARGWRSERAY